MGNIDDMCAELENDFGPFVAQRFFNQIQTAGEVIDGFEDFLNEYTAGDGDFFFAPLEAMSVLQH